MATLYKLTRQNNTTSGDTTLEWGAGVSHTATGPGTLLCSRDVIHAYTHPLLAVLLSPRYSDYENPKLWRCEGEVVADDHGLIVGVKTLTTIEKMPLPILTIEQRVKFAILCAKHICKREGCNTWADKWLSGEDRSPASARKLDPPWGCVCCFWTAQAAANAGGSCLSGLIVASVAREVAAMAERAARWAIVTKMLPLNLIDLAEQAIQI